LTLYYRSFFATWIFFLGIWDFFSQQILDLRPQNPKRFANILNPKVLLPAVGIIHMDFRLKSTVPDFFAKKPGNSEGVGFFVEGPRFHEKKGHTEP